MAELTQLSFELGEVTAALLESEGITSGKWVLSFEFAVSTGAVGLPDDIKPGAMAQIVRVQLTKATDENASDSSLVDALMLRAMAGLTSLE